MIKRNVDPETEARFQRIRQEILDLDLLNRPVLLVDFDQEEIQVHLRGLAIDEHEYICAVVSRDEHDPAVELRHWSSFREFFGLWLKDQD